MGVHGAARAVTVCVVPADSVIPYGAPVTVRVTADGPTTDLKGYSIRLTYAPSVLGSPVTAGGDVLASVTHFFVPYGAPPDTIGFDAAVLVGTTGGPGTLGTFELSGLTPGVSVFHLTFADLRDSHNNQFPVTMCDGKVTVLPPPPAAVRVCAEPADTTVFVGQPVTLRITADGPPSDLQGYSIRLTHNPLVMGAPLSIDEGSVIASVPHFFYPYTAAPDTLGCDAASLGPTTNGPGTLMTIPFVPMGPGTCIFRVTLAILRNAANESLDVVTCEGRVTVQAVTQAEPSTWGRIKSLYRF